MSTKEIGMGGSLGLGDYVELDLESGKQMTVPKHAQSSTSSSTSDHNVVIGVNLSSNWMSPFDFSALQDIECKYIASVQWLTCDGSIDSVGARKSKGKDTAVLPIIVINTSSAADVNEIVSSMAAEEIIIPKVSLVPTKLSCRTNQDGTFDLALQFQLKKTSTNPEDWANWSLQFIQNQLHDSFAAVGAQEMNEPFQITLARGIVWKSEKHMKDFLAQSERLLYSWNHKGPSALMSEEIYVVKNGIATNCFKHNMATPYHSKVNRCLISNVINKVSLQTDVSAPAVAWYMMDTVTSGVRAIHSALSPLASSASKRLQPDDLSVVDTVTSGVRAIHSAVSPLASSASRRLQSDDLSVGALTFAEEARSESLKHFNYALYLRVKSKKVNIKGIAQEQNLDIELQTEMKLHPKMFCTKQVGESSVILAKGRDDRYRIVVPKSLKGDILELHHECLVNPTAVSNFESDVYDTFTWNGIHQDVKQYVEKARREEARRDKENAQRNANQKKVIPIGGINSQRNHDESVQVIPVINDDVKKKWWKPLSTKKGERHKKNASNPNTLDSPPALVKLSTVSTASGLSSSNSRQQPSITEEINDDNYRLIAELPGVQPENLKVDFCQGGRVLKVSGTQQMCQGNLTETNQFEKCFTVSAADLNTAAAIARLSNGVLIVTVPKTFALS